MNLKMIVLDLDGTLLRDDKTISKITVPTLKKCREEGIKIVFATARGLSAHKLVPIDLFDGFARMCGAEAFAGKINVYGKYVSTVKVRDFLNIANKAGIKIAAESNGWHYANFNVSEIWDWLSCYEIVDFNALDIEAEKLYAFPKVIDELELLKNNLPKGFHIITTRNNFTMVLHEDAQKSKAVSALAEYWEINSSEIVAFGDDLSDIDLIKYCGFGVAMGNALDEVKAVANCICDTNENDGVVKWLEENMKIIISTL